MDDAIPGRVFVGEGVAGHLFGARVAKQRERGETRAPPLGLMIGDRRDLWDEDQREIIERLGEERVADGERDSVAKAAAKKRMPRR